jgi:PIN domain nuclease of toxin-antitoxin system
VSLLLDTHVILWWLTDDPALSDEMKTRLDDEPGLYVSPASLWEVTIKQSIGKLSEPIDLAEETGNSGFRELPVTFRHGIAAGRLPLIHRDPFDRMLVAQAHCEAMTLASRDPHIQRYDVALLRV